MTKYIHKNEKAAHEQNTKAWEDAKPQAPTGYEAKEVKKSQTVQTGYGEAVAQEGDFILSAGGTKFVVHADDLENNWAEVESS